MSVLASVSSGEIYFGDAVIELTPEEECALYLWLIGNGSISL